MSEDLLGPQFGSTQPKFGAQGGRLRAGGHLGRSDPRGNSASRRARVTWMKSAESGYGGNGSVVPCVHCGTPTENPEADRIRPGGPYRRNNIQPSCRSCNLARTNNAAWQGPKSIPVTGRKWGFPGYD
jgi:hypothetical protein